MSQSITIRRRTTRRRRRASRIGSPPVRRLPRSVRRMSTCSPRRSCSARRVRRVGVAISRRLIRRYRRASSPGSSASKRLVRSRSSSLAATGTARSRGRRRRARPRRAAREPAGAIAALRERRAGAVDAAVLDGAVVGRRRGCCARPREPAARVSPSPAPKTVARTPRRTRGPASRRRRASRARSSTAAAAPPAARAASASAKRAARSGVTGTPASCSRRAERARERRAGRARSSARVNRASAHSRLPTSCSRPGRADDVLVLGVLEHRPERPVHRGRVERLDAEQLERGQPVDRLGDARRLLHVARADPRDRRRRPARRASPTRPSPGGARSRPRARATGSRSSGTGSGA